MYIHIYIFVYRNKSKYIYIRVYMCAYVRKHASQDIPATQPWQRLICVCVCVCVCACVFMRAYRRLSITQSISDVEFNPYSSSKRSYRSSSRTRKRPRERHLRCVEFHNVCTMNIVSFIGLYCKRRTILRSLLIVATPWHVTWSEQGKDCERDTWGVWSFTMYECTHWGFSCQYDIM